MILISYKCYIFEKKIVALELSSNGIDEMKTSLSKRP